MRALKDGGANAHIISKYQDMLKGSNGEEIEVDKNYHTTAAVLYDAIYVPGGKESIETLKMQGDAIHFVFCTSLAFIFALSPYTVSLEDPPPQIPPLRNSCILLQGARLFLC